MASPHGWPDWCCFCKRARAPCSTADGSFFLKPLFTPDGRYLIVRARLWRTTNPALLPEVRSALVQQLMQARRAVKDALQTDDAEQLRTARAAVHTAKVALGERGPVWWTDAAPDYNRHLVHNSPYAAWFKGLAQA